MAAEILGLLLLLHLLVAFLVYQDAKNNSPQSAALWALVVLVAGFLLGVLLYVLLGRDTSASTDSRRPPGHNRTTKSDTEDEPMNVDDSGPF